MKLTLVSIIIQGRRYSAFIPAKSASSKTFGSLDSVQDTPNVITKVTPRRYSNEAHTRFNRNPWPQALRICPAWTRAEHD